MERKAFRQRMQQYKQARESNPQLKYWDWKKYADGTDGVNDFITEQIKQKIQQAFDKSKTRTMPSVPLVGGTKNPQTPEQFDLERSKALQKYQKEMQNIESQGIYNFTTGQKDIPLHLQRQYEVAKKSYDTWNNMVYQPTIGGAIGPSCIYTATDNYGSQYLQPSNIAFMNQPASISGFTKIDNSNVQPGDIVIRTDGNNNHAMIYAGRDARGPIYNHSNGGQEASDYRKNAHYPATNEQLSTYRFTGTHNDSVQWKKQYKAYADGGEVRDNTYVAPIYKEQVFIPATGAQKIKNDYQYKYGSKSQYKGGELEIVSPEFDILNEAKTAYDTTVGLINNLSRTNRTRKIVNSFKKNLKTSDKLDVLKDNPEFGQIGTPFDYSNYIDDIFKDSQLKGIYYHGGPKGIEKFRAPKDPEFVLNKAINSGAEEQGIYFTGDKGLANYYKSSNKNGKIYKVKLNSQNPYYTNDWFAVRIRSALDKDYVYPGSITDRVRFGILKDRDAVVWHGRLGENIVFDPDQIHILGSKKDMQLFNDYIKNKHSYKNGGVIDEDPPQNTSERPIINFDPKGDPYNPIYGYNPGAGYTKSAFDLYDAPIIGDALSVYDATEAAKNKQWLSAGLAALGVLPFVPRVGNKTIRKIDNYFAEEAYEAALKKSSRPNISVPTVEGYRKSLDQQLNRITSTPDLSTLEREADWNNLINREIEKIYDPEVRKRAAKIDKDRGTTLQYYYDDLHRNYTENYDRMPKARLVDNIEGGAKAQMTLTQEARERLKKDGSIPSWGDFEMRVDRSTPLDPEVAQHEVAHFNQYMNNGSSDLNRLPYGTGKQHMRKDNPVLTKEDPVGYYDNIGEQGAYQLNIINEMLKKKIPVTQKNYINFVKKLPTSSSKRKAVEQFNTYKDAYNWTKMMPLTGVAGITWLNYNKEE